MVDYNAKIQDPQEDTDGDEIQLRDTDVLLGRGTHIALFKGNVYFRYLVWKMKDIYNEAKKSEKGDIARLVMQQVHNLTPPGRFVQETEDGKFELAKPQKAFEKTCQTLRERKNGKPRNYEKIVEEYEAREGVDPQDIELDQFVIPNAPKPSKSRFTPTRNDKNKVDTAKTPVPVVPAKKKAPKKDSKASKVPRKTEKTKTKAKTKKIPKRELLSTEDSDEPPTKKHKTTASAAKNSTLSSNKTKKSRKSVCEDKKLAKKAKKTKSKSRLPKKSSKKSKKSPEVAAAGKAPATPVVIDEQTRWDVFDASFLGLPEFPEFVFDQPPQPVTPNSMSPTTLPTCESGSEGESGTDDEVDDIPVPFPVFRRDLSAAAREANAIDMMSVNSVMSLTQFLFEGLPNTDSSPAEESHEGRLITCETMPDDPEGDLFADFPSLKPSGLVKNESGIFTNSIPGCAGIKAFSSSQPSLMDFVPAMLSTAERKEESTTTLTPLPSSVQGSVAKASLGKCLAFLDQN